MATAGAGERTVGYRRPCGRCWSTTTTRSPTTWSTTWPKSPGERRKWCATTIRAVAGAAGRVRQRRSSHPGPARRGGRGPRAGAGRRSPAVSCRCSGCALATRDRAPVRRQGDARRRALPRADVLGGCTGGPACSRGCPRRSRSCATTRWPSAICRPSWRATAWTPDGVLMGLRHRDTAAVGRAVPPRVDPHRARAPAAAQLRRDLAPCRPGPAGTDAATGRRSPMPHACWSAPSADRGTTESVFDRLFRRAEHAFWLDRTGRGSTARFSIMGGGSAGHGHRGRRRGTVTVRLAERPRAVQRVPPLAGGRDPERCRVRGPSRSRSAGSATLGYELKAECGAARRAPVAVRRTRR